MPSMRIGALRRPHGVRGAVKVESYSGESDHFRTLREIELVGPRDERVVMTVSSVAVHNGVPVLTFDEVDTPESIRRYSGWEIVVERTAAAPLNDDEYYVADLIGAEVVVGNDRVGTVIAVAEGAQAPLLEMRRTESPDSGTVLIPFMERFVGTVDVVGGRVELKERWILDSE